MNGQKNKAGFRLNIIDVILIAIVLACGALLVYMFTSSSLISNNNQVEIEYTVEFRQLRDEFVGEDFIKKGDKVTDTVTLYSIGEVTAVSYSDYIYVGVDSDGQLVESPYPNYVNMLITIRATADVSDGVYSVGGYTVAVGKSIALRVPNLVGEGYCQSITELEG